MSHPAICEHCRRIVWDEHGYYKDKHAYNCPQYNKTLPVNQVLPPMTPIEKLRNAAKFARALSRQLENMAKSYNDTTGSGEFTKAEKEAEAIFKVLRAKMEFLPD